MNQWTIINLSLDVATTRVIWVVRLASRTRIISSLAFRILLSRHCALKSAAAASVDKSTLDVDLYCVFRCARLCQDACVSASVEYYNWPSSFLTSFSRPVRAPIRQHHKVTMLQWPRRLRTVTSDQLWWSPRSCTDMQRWRDSPSNWLFFKQARNVRMGRPSRQAGSWKLHGPPTPTHPALYDPIFTSLESTCWHSLWCFVFLPTPLWCPPPFVFPADFYTAKYLAKRENKSIHTY